MARVGHKASLNHTSAFENRRIGGERLKWAHSGSSLCSHHSHQDVAFGSKMTIPTGPERFFEFALRPRHRTLTAVFRCDALGQDRVFHGRTVYLP
jgi:hypothetical protein